MMYQFAIQVILILIIISSVIAYIGNYVGRYFGKKRLSLFGLRPRYTAIIFTIFSGIIIAGLTFVTVIFISRDARTAFFGLEKLRGQISEARKELASSKEQIRSYAGLLEQNIKDMEKTKDEIQKLQKTRAALNKEIEIATSRKVIYNANEVIYKTVFAGGGGKIKAEGDIAKVLKYLVQNLKDYKISRIKYDDGDYNATVSYLANINSEVVFRVISNKNLTPGGMLFIRFEVASNELLFHKGDELAKAFISGKLNLADSEMRVRELISKAEDAAKNKGVLPDLAGSLGYYPYQKIYDAIRRIRGYGTLTKVSILAEADIYSAGPLEIDLNVLP